MQAKTFKTHSGGGAKSMKSYTFEEAMEASTKYFMGDDLAANVWIKKYALKDSHGRIYEKSPHDMHKRIAKEIARIEQNYKNPMSEQEIFALLKNFKYILPQGSPMSGIGNDFQISSLSNCFVIGNEADSYGGIIRTDEEQAQLMKRRGGVGHDLSHIRPLNSPVLNSALTSTGIVPFMERFSRSTREVAQDGRRGALMLSVSIKHPDSEHFIDAKMTEGKVTGANVSIKLDDEFMRKALAKETYKTQFPIDSDNPSYVKDIDAAKLWDKINFNAWQSAEPGILFWDTIIRESIPDCYADLGFKTVSTNPCGEIPLCPYDSCRLLAINLYGYVKNPFTEEATFDFELFADHVQKAQRIMDDVIDLEIEKIEKILDKVKSDPEPIEIKRTEIELWEKIKEKTLLGRRTGVGITAEGDMLAALGIRYGTMEAIDFSVEVHKYLALNAYRASVTLAKERGMFEIYDASREMANPFINRIREADEALYEDMIKYGRRNISLLTIAPTGTTSMLAQTSSGIEPAFMISYKRRKKVNAGESTAKVAFTDKQGDAWEEYTVFHHKFVDWLKINGYDVEEVKHMEQKELDEIIKKSPYHKATANDIDWVAKVKMQGAIQKWVDHSISVTVNIPKESSVELVKEIYKTAWESGCKGCTIYREGSRDGVLISNNNDSAKDSDEFGVTNSPKRPKKLKADIIHFWNNNEKWIAVVGLLSDRPYEIFTGKAEGFFDMPEKISASWVVKEREENGKSRYDLHYINGSGNTNIRKGLSSIFDKEYWNYAKLISGILRHGMPLQYVVHLVSKMHMDSDNINSWKKGVVRALKKYVVDGTEVPGKVCPKCGASMFFQEGCHSCANCGHSECA